MIIREIKDYTDIKITNDCILVLGYFDGMHKGHAQLFSKARELAQETGLKIVVLTFKKSPKLTFAKFSPDLLLHLTYPEKRYQKFEEFHVDELYLLDFSSTFAKLNSKDFIKDYILSLGAKKIIVGFDYKFGQDQKSAYDLQESFTGDTYIIDEIVDEGIKISSTRIRQLVTNGEIEKANQLLGYTYSTRGIVVHGDARGRTIGFPTANLAMTDRTFLPDDGVYVTDVKIDGQLYRSMTSIGKNITFGGTELRIEANIFDFNQEIYGESVEIFWLARIREMIKFTSIDDLIRQLESDRNLAINYKNDSQEA